MMRSNNLRHLAGVLCIATTSLFTSCKSQQPIVDDSTDHRNRNGLEYSSQPQPATSTKQNESERNPTPKLSPDGSFVEIDSRGIQSPAVSPTPPARDNKLSEFAPLPSHLAVSSGQKSADQAASACTNDQFIAKHSLVQNSSMAASLKLMLMCPRPRIFFLIHETSGQIIVGDSTDLCADRGPVRFYSAPSGLRTKTLCFTSTPGAIGGVSGSIF
jgi:hypothetical protein